MATQTVPGVFFSRSAESPPLPIVIDSPHSGFDYPPDFCPVAPVAAVLTSCDRFVDELWGAAPQYGATLVAALFPRAYIDPRPISTPNSWTKLGRAPARRAIILGEEWDSFAATPCPEFRFTNAS